MKNKFIVPVLFIFFLLIVPVYFLILHSFAIVCNGWIIGDWLINFDGGFVRRGLSGYLILKLSDLLNVKPNFTVMAVQMTIYLSYMAVLFFLIYRKKINVWFILMLLSPVTVLFPIHSSSAAGRKEIILFFLFALFILCLQKKILKSPFIILLFFLAILVATSFHELFFFFMPYFIAASYLKSKIDNEPFHFRKMLLVISGSFLMIILFCLFGKNINGSVICSSLMARGLPDNICHGILSWPENYSFKDALKYAMEGHYISVYGTELFLGLVPFVLFIKYLKDPVLRLKQFFIAFLFLFLFSSPMFLLAIDWGRWINIHFVLLLFTSTLLLEDNLELKGGWAQEYIAIPRLWKSVSSKPTFTNNSFFCVIAFFYLTSWEMYYYNGNSILTLHFYKLVYHKIHSVINFL